MAGHKPKKNILALDIGTVRIGVAVSNPERTVALAIGTIHLKECHDPYAEIAGILDEYETDRLVVGWPLQLDGSEGPATRRTRQFLAAFKKRYPHVRIMPQDERLTSQAAENALQEMDTRGSDKKNAVDSMAACMILQMYLDRNSAGNGG